MARSDRIICSKCHGENDRGGRFCWYCGAPLGWERRTSRAQAVALEIGVRLGKWLVFLAALAGVVYGVYYALDRYVWPAVDSETVSTSTDYVGTSSTVLRTTTTTLPPREDRVVLGAADRYATAIAISEMAFPDGAEAVVLVPGDDYSQGLAAAPLAAVYGGPVLLVPPEGLRDDVAAEVQRLSPSQIFLVALNSPRSAETKLKALLEETTITRITGGDAYETAAAIADELEGRLGTVTKVVLAPSDSFLEALIASPLAAANGWPILLAPTEGNVPYATRKAIERLEATSALVIGLNSEVGLDKAEAQIGTDSFDTAALVVQYAVDHGCDFGHTALAPGDNFPEAMVTASYVALDKGILMPTTDGQLPESLMSILNANLGDVDRLDFIALPQLARQMAATQTPTSTTQSAGSTTTTTERNTPTPSAGGY